MYKYRMNVQKEVLKELKVQYPNLGIKNVKVENQEALAEDNVFRGGIEFLGNEFHYNFSVDREINAGVNADWESLVVDRVVFMMREKIDEHFQIRHYHPAVRYIHFLDDNQLNWVEDYLIMTDWKQIYRKLPEIES